MELNIINSSGLTDLIGLESYHSQPYLVSQWFLWIYITIIEIGGLFSNGVLAGYLFRRRSFEPVLHLCIADIASLLFLAPYEILALADSSGVWTFPAELCKIFLGLEVLFGTSTIYVLIVINFSAVTGSQHNSLNLNVPLVTVWLLAVSLSVPDFVFGEVITPRPEYYICCLPKRAAFLICTFRLVFPVFLILTGTALVIIFLFQAPQDTRYLWLALILSLTYIAISVQRSVFGVIYGATFMPSSEFGFRTPPLADIIQNPVGTLALALVHYTLSALRPCIVWIFSPDMRSSIIFVSTSDQVE